MTCPAARGSLPQNLTADINSTATFLTYTCAIDYRFNICIHSIFCCYRLSIGHCHSLQFSYFIECRLNIIILYILPNIINYRPKIVTLYILSYIIDYLLNTMILYIFTMIPIIDKAFSSFTHFDNGFNFLNPEVTKIHCSIRGRVTDVG